MSLTRSRGRSGGPMARPQDGYPPSQVVSGLSLSLNAGSVRFTACRRTTSGCVDRVETLGSKRQEVPANIALEPTAQE